MVAFPVFAGEKQGCVLQKHPGFSPVSLEKSRNIDGFVFFFLLWPC